MVGPAGLMAKSLPSSLPMTSKARKAWIGAATWPRWKCVWGFAPHLTSYPKASTQRRNPYATFLPHTDSKWASMTYGTTAHCTLPGRSLQPTLKKLIIIWRRGRPSGFAPHSCSTIFHGSRISTSSTTHLPLIRTRLSRSQTG